jgi:hypothetical protein
MAGTNEWAIPMRPEANGVVLVDTMEQPWPDHMGDPEKEMGLFGSWSMGSFGPHTWPGCLERAAHFARAQGREFAAEAAACHRGFVRVRSSYVLGADDKAKVVPEDWDPAAELEFVNKVALAVAKVDGALCYFNPGGETLHTAAGAEELIAEMMQQEVPPLPVWSEARVSNVEEVAGWMMVDTVGMQQVGAQDMEGFFPARKYDLSEVVNFLRNCAAYLMESGPVIKDGETADGPGGRWQAMHVEDSYLPTPREVLRWWPESLSLPAVLRRKKREAE